MAGNPKTPYYAGLTRKAGDGRPVFNGTVKLMTERLSQPLRWKKPRRVFVDSMSDLFHPDVPVGFLDRVFAVMADTPRHTFQILTKRPARMKRYLAYDQPPKNVWLGTSVEDQTTADERIPHLVQTPAAVRFLSCEPLLGTVDVTGGPWLDWVIVGGESGPRARPCNVEWIREIVRQCREAGVPCFVKQLGAKPYDLAGDSLCDDGSVPVGAYLDLHSCKGGDMSEWPEDLRVREYPDP